MYEALKAGNEVQNASGVGGAGYGRGILPTHLTFLDKTLEMV